MPFRQAVANRRINDPEIIIPRLDSENRRHRDRNSKITFLFDICCLHTGAEAGGVKISAFYGDTMGPEAGKLLNAGNTERTLSLKSFIGIFCFQGQAPVRGPVNVCPTDMFVSVKKLKPALE